LRNEKNRPDSINIKRNISPQISKKIEATQDKAIVSEIAKTLQTNNKTVERISKRVISRKCWIWICWRSISEPKAQLELFQEFYNYFDFFQDEIDISIVELQEKRMVYRLSNSEFLTDKFLYFFYVACGITEGIYRLIVSIKVECNVENISISNNIEESYIDISLEIK